MTRERILHYRAPTNTTGIIIGNASLSSGGAPGGTGIQHQYTMGWWPQFEMHGRLWELECINQSFGDSYGNLQTSLYQIEPALMYPPYVSKGATQRFFRLRGIIGGRITQFDAGFPQTSRMFYGFQRQFQMRDLIGASWVAFYAKAVGGTFGNWFAVVSDDVETVLLNEDLGVSADSVMRNLRLDLNGPAGTIDWYINEELLYSWTVPSGVLGGDNYNIAPKPGVGLNVGYQSGQSTNCIGEFLVDIMNYGDILLTEVLEAEV